MMKHSRDHRETRWMPELSPSLFFSFPFPVFPCDFIPSFQGAQGPCELQGLSDDLDQKHKIIL